jgi:hypothetical protein
MIGLLQEKSEIEKLQKNKKLSELNFNIEEISHLPRQLSKKNSSLKNVKPLQ